MEEPAVGLLEEQRILTSQYMEISTKYKSLIQTLDEQWNKIHEAKIKQLDIKQGGLSTGRGSENK